MYLPKMRQTPAFFLLLSLLVIPGCQPGPVEQVDVLIIGGGASGVMAGIQAARLGVKVAIVEETPWLGGMLTAAGVSAIDGNHRLPSGLWGEFREKLYEHYGGTEGVATGWVSNTLFEPSVGDSILKEMAGLDNLEIFFETRWQSVEKAADKWVVQIESNQGRKAVESRVLIDATELGDVMAALGVPYSLGMGALLALVCDLIVRLTGPVHAMPLNAVTALLGVPVVVMVLVRGRRWARMS